MGLVYGVGINDCIGWTMHETEQQKKRLEYRIYQAWTNMLGRCYCEAIIKAHPAYKGCSVCGRWLTLSNFAEDIKLLEGYELWRDNPLQRIALDKDSKKRNNRVYSPETCCFLTFEDNAREVMLRRRSDIYTERALKNKLKAICKAVICTFENGREEKFPSALEAERKYGFNHSVVSAICNGKGRKTHHGCKFRYA